ncbi:MAG TPA: HEPN domain-containing protein [Thermoanaerobaculia bacterium]|nr:HEPN domain-containing protein [Thermoanaerobaculia bacterium]
MTRLTNPIEGRWWLPGERRKSRQGSLQQRLDGHLELTLRRGWQRNVMLGLDRAERVTLLGEDDAGRPISLWSGFLKESSLMAPETAPAIFHFDAAFLGYHFPSEDVATLTELSARVPALDQWLGISGFGIEEPFEDPLTIHFSKPKNIELELEPGLKLVFGFSSRGPILRRAQLEVHIRQEAWLILRADPAKSYKDLSKVFSRILNLISLLVNEPLGYESKLAEVAHARKKHQEGGPTRVEIFFAPIAPEHIDKSVEEHTMLLRFKDIELSHLEVFQRWLERYRVCGPAFDSYFATQRVNPAYQEQRFMSIVQPLETLHRLTNQGHVTEKHQKRLDRIIESCPKDRKWLTGKLRHSHEPTLATRLEDLLEPFGDLFGGPEEHRRLAEKASDTRNYLTHYDSKMKDRAVEPAKLTPYIFRLNVLFILRCLLELGLKPDEARQRVDKNHRLHQMVRFGKI